MNNFFKQFSNLWSKLGLNQKVSIVLSLLAVIAGMAALLVWSSWPRMQLLYGRLESGEMSDVVTAVEEQSIPYEISAGGTSIYVSRDKVYQLRAELAAKGIPSGGGVGFEIFDRANFGVSDFVQRTNYIRAIQGELARTVTQMRGVNSARVMVVVPESRLLVEGREARPTASVFFDTGGITLAADAVNSIRFLVANSVEGLLLDDVAVVDNHGNLLTEDMREDAVIGAASGQFKFRRELESYFGNKIESMLSKIVGSGSVVARVSVELENETSSIVEERYDPDGQVVRSQTITEDTNVSNESPGRETDIADAGLPGAEREVASVGSVSSTQESRKNKTTTYEINRSTVEVMKYPGTIKRLSAAVFLALRYSGEGEKQSPQPRAAEEIETIRGMVVNALGVAGSAATTEQLVTVEEVPFAKSVSVGVQGGFETKSNIFQWFETIRNFSAVGIAVVMFVIFLRMIKRHQSDITALEVISEGNQGMVARAQDVTPLITADVLNKLIQEKPENVSSTLKHWAQSSARR